VLTTNVGSVPDLVRDEETGIVIPPLDWKALARELIRLAEDAGLRRQLGDCAREFAHGHCSIQTNITGLENIFQELAPDDQGKNRLESSPPCLARDGIDIWAYGIH
jgi:glycosyltransferase involved in cell wall biosynthesis